MEILLIFNSPPAHSLTISEVSKYFEKNKEPTQDDEFAETIRKSLLLWPNTSFFENGDKLKDSFLEVAVEKLSEHITDVILRGLGHRPPLKRSGAVSSISDRRVSAKRARFQRAIIG